MLYKNKLRSYYYLNNIVNPIFYYKDFNLNFKKFQVKKLLVNIKIIREKNIKLYNNLIAIFFFCKLFSNKFAIKNLLSGLFNNFLKKIDNFNIFCIIQIILKSKNFYIFLNFVYFFFKSSLKKKLFFINKKFVLNFLKKFKTLSTDLQGLLEISIEKQNDFSSKKKLYFFINFLSLLNDKQY